VENKKPNNLIKSRNWRDLCMKDRRNIRK